MREPEFPRIYPEKDKEVFGDEGQEGRAAHSPKHFLILFWINPRKFRLSHLWISSPLFHLGPRDERSRGQEAERESLSLGDSEGYSRAEG